MKSTRKGRLVFLSGMILLLVACQKMEWREDVFLEAVSINDELYDSDNPTQREVENGDTLLVKYRFECPTGFAELFCSPNFEEDYSTRILVAPKEGDLEGEIFPIQLAFGNNIGKYFALYAGGQYQYTTFGIEYLRNNPMGYRNVYIGGNQRGAGVHAVFAKGMFFARYSFMYDWIRAAKTFTGNAQTHEFVLHFGPQKLGAFVKFNYVYREMDPGYLPVDRTELSKPEGRVDMAVLPSEIGSQYSFSVGIFAQGLFSGISSMGARGLSETERGLRKERNEDKRRKIEWKE